MEPRRARDARNKGLTMRSILVVNAKGGCGKTTVATNLASYYAVHGKKTALVDMDPQKSSLEWLAQRPEWREPILGVDGSEGRTVSLPVNIDRVVLDSPARITGQQLGDMVRRADVVVVPVLPSPIDIRAAAHFVAEMLVRGKITAQHRKVTVVANRVKEHTLVYEALEKFLKSLKIPFVTHLRDSMNYIRAADRGIGVYELAPYLVEKDLEQWKPLVRWLERKR
jgi:chromosome partitioning protein